MDQNELYQRLQAVFADVFDDDSIALTPETTAADIEDWDSLQHITLINAVEQEFKMRFSMKQVSTMKNVGEMVAILADAEK